MNAPAHTASMPLGLRAFGDTPWTPAEHFRLSMLSVIAHLIEACGDGDPAEALAAHPFLSDYAEEIGAHLGNKSWTAAEWWMALATWESAAESNEGSRLPLLRLLGAGLSRLDLELLLAVGLPEEDPRFSDLFEQMSGRERRPTPTLLLAWWRLGPDGDDRIEDVRRAIFALVQAGLILVQNEGAPRSEWALAVADPLWDGLRGSPPEVHWLRLVPPRDLLPLSDYIAPAEVSGGCQQLPDLLKEQPNRVLVLRGPRHNGRKTLLGALARELGMGLLAVEDAPLDDERQWRLLGALAVTLNAMPVIELRLSSGVSRALGALPLYQGPIGVAAGYQGGVETHDDRTLLNLTLPIPGADIRHRHWQAAAPEHAPGRLDDLARSVRLTSGNVRRAAAAALGYAKLDGRPEIQARDLQLACRGFQGARLENLATRLETRGSLSDLALDESTRTEIETLVARCRHREALAAQCHEGALGAAGVRALFTGPSGTGKTLAARLLANTLHKDLFRVDLAATVNKYLGETEKNLDQAFGVAEELDIVLLLDEGDSLMTARTDVGSSNDRYANLETNFLLQRIEAFSGILLVTTNAAERIDKAFTRRMDLVVPFRAPDEWQRYQILSWHLEAPWLDDDLVQEVAARCALTGGQIRNLVLHARLLAIQAGRPLDAADLNAAVLREYRKTGAHCPLNLHAEPDGGMPW